MRLGLLREPGDGLSHHLRACTLGAESACRTVAEVGEVWVTLPPDLLFAEQDRPASEIEMAMQPGETLRLELDLCIRDGRPVTAAVRTSSGEPGLDEAMLHTASRWRFSTRPPIPKDVALCRTWPIRLIPANESPAWEWRRRHGKA